MLAFGAVSALAGCSLSDDDVVGSVDLALVGQAPSGATYRLRDATITVAGPTSKVWHTEDDPDQTSLSASVPPGAYSATLGASWRVERLVGATATTVDAELVSDNPAPFTVAAGQRTAVTLQFRVDTELVDLSQGYDIAIGVQEAPLFLAVASPGDFSNPPSLSVYGAHASGDLAPLRRISGPSSLVGSAFGVAVAGGQLIATDLGGAINFWPVDASGDVAPVRRIVGPATQLTGPVGIAVAGGEIFVAQPSGSVMVFPLTASGNVAPSRVITGLSIPSWVAVDHGELYVSDYPSTIAVYPITASGAATPTRTITPEGASGINGIVVSRGEIFVGYTGGDTGVRAYPAAASGSVASLRVISPAIPGTFSAEGLARFGQELYVAANLSSVRVFAANASGSVPPTREIGGPNTHFGFIYGVAVF